MLSMVILETDELPMRTIKQAINQTADGVKFSLAAVSILSAFGAIFFICALIDLAALCLFFTCCGAWTAIACLIRYDMHIQSLVIMHEHTDDDTIDF